MSTQVTGAVMASPTSPPNVGTLCCCERPDCAGTTVCYREYASTETGWRKIADRRPRWTLANGQVI